MLVTAYRIRSQGARRETDTIRQTPVVGEFKFRTRLIGRKPGWDIKMATLFVPGTTNYAFPVLDAARILKIDERGILVTGMEVIPRSHGTKNIKSDNYPQTWWCEFRAPAPPGEPGGGF